MSSHKFDRDYFENGVRTGKSLYKDYRWMPEVSLPLADTVKRVLETKYNPHVLDYGCAKGFTVHALRLLGVYAFGYDISEYALTHCKPEIKQCLYNDREKVPEVQAILCKDVLEHMSYERIYDELSWIRSHCHRMLAIVPFGNGREYRIEEYGFDDTHIIKENEEWWACAFLRCGFTIESFSHRMPNIKENWYKHNKIGNGFYTLI